MPLTCPLLLLTHSWQGEVASLSCEPHPGGEVVVSLFEVDHSAAAVASFVEREHEFRFVAVRPQTLGGTHAAAAGKAVGQGAEVDHSTSAVAMTQD